MAIHKVDGVDGANNFPKKHVVLHGTAAITAGNVVMLNLADTTNGLGGSVVTCTNTANGEQLALGIAVETTTDAGTIKIQTAGKYENANVGTPTVAGDSLICSNASDAAVGRLVVYAAADVAPIFAVALESENAATGVEPASGLVNKADIMIYDKGFF